MCEQRTGTGPREDDDYLGDLSVNGSGGLPNLAALLGGGSDAKKDAGAGAFDFMDLFTGLLGGGKGGGDFLGLFTGIFDAVFGSFASDGKSSAKSSGGGGGGSSEGSGSSSTSDADGAGSSERSSRSSSSDSEGLSDGDSSRASRSSSRGGSGGASDAKKGALDEDGVLGGLLGLTKAGGLKEVEPDLALAKKLAKNTLDAIDFSKPNILIDFEGTFSHKLNPAYAQGAGPNASTVNVDYPADLNMNENAATNKKAFELMMQDPRMQGKKIAIVGYSQGGFAVSEIMGDAKLRKHVDKAIAIGLPSAARFQFDGGKDPKTVEVTNANDEFGGRNKNVNLMAFLAPKPADNHGAYNFQQIVADNVPW